MRKEQLFRYKKYLGISLRHITLKKVLNLIKVETRYRKKRIDMKGVYPYNIFVDLNNRCNLKCPICFMGRGDVIDRPNNMNLENYKKILKPIAPYITQVFLYNNSEPFLNKDIYDIIKFNNKSNVGTIVSSNLSLDIDPVKLVKSKLDYLIVSIDGITQDIYEQYRVNGNLEKVIGNLKEIIRVKKELKSKTPFIEWQSIISSKNYLQMKEIEEFAYNIGVDVVRFGNLNFYPLKGEEKKAAQKEWLPPTEEFRFFDENNEKIVKSGKRKSCFWLWRAMIISANGGVIPCCLFDTEDWGNLFEESFEDIWNGEKYNSARKLGIKENAGKTGTICDRCNATFIYE